MAQDFNTLARTILDKVGGEKNVAQVTHCMTRLRFNLKDESKAVPDDEMKAVKGVLGVVRSGGQYQVIIGQTVNKVYEEVNKLGSFGGGVPVEKVKEKLTLKKIGMNILNYLAGSLTPLIPVIIAAAMVKTVLAVIGPSMLGLVHEGDNLYTLLTFVGDAGFYFLPILIGYTASIKMGMNPAMGMFMGAILVHPTLVQMATEGVTGFTVYGIPMAVQNYSSSVLPIILSVWVMSYIFKFLNDKLSPALRTIFAPTLTVFIMLPISLCGLAPLGGMIGEYISKGLLAFGSVGGFVAVAVIAAVWEYLVMSGMHIVLVVTMMTMIMQNGSEALVSPAASCATMAAVGMALGAALRMKDEEERAMGIGYFVSGILGGVTEPALYGVGFKYKRPLIGMMIGGALGGLYAGLTHVAVYGMGATNFLMAMTFAGGGTANLVNGIISLVIALVGAAAATYALGLGKDASAEAQTSEQAQIAEASDVTEVSACISGKVIPASEIKDETFSSGMMGLGVGIVPAGDTIVAPCDAVVSTVMADSKHAVGLTLSNGVELLIHEGLDTVGLNGEGFELFVTEGQKVKKGDRLIRFDSEVIKGKGLDDVCVVLVTNSDDYPNAQYHSGIQARSGETAIITF